MLVGYARVSTIHQDTDLQTRALKEAGCEKIFEETASGAQKDRPALREALNYLRDGLDTLVVWKLDRLARSTRQLIQTMEDLDARGIQFRSLTETIQTDTSTGRLIFNIFASLAEFERDMIRERTMEGLKAAKARGRALGRPTALSEEDLAQIDTLLENPTITRKRIAERFGISRSTLYKYRPGK